MNLFSKKNEAVWSKPFPEKLANRVSRIPTGDLEAWADQALFDIGRCLTQYAKNRDAIHLEEALVGAEALHSVIDDMVERRLR